MHAMWEPVVIDVPLELEQKYRDEREERAKRFPQNRYENTPGFEDRFFGDMAEGVVADWLDKLRLPYVWHQENPRGIHDFDVCGMRVDVKNKRTRGPAKPTHHYMIDAKCRGLPLDYYLLTFYQWQCRRMWIVGFGHVVDYYNRSTFYRHGAVLPSNGHTVKGDDVDHVDDVAWVTPPRMWLNVMSGREVMQMTWDGPQMVRLYG